MISSIFFKSLGASSRQMNGHECRHTCVVHLFIWHEWKWVYPGDAFTIHLLVCCLPTLDIPLFVWHEWTWVYHGDAFSIHFLICFLPIAEPAPAFDQLYPRQPKHSHHSSLSAELLLIEIKQKSNKIHIAYTCINSLAF